MKTCNFCGGTAPSDPYRDNAVAPEPEMVPVPEEKEDSELMKSLKRGAANVAYGTFRLLRWIACLLGLTVGVYFFGHFFLLYVFGWNCPYTGADWAYGPLPTVNWIVGLAVILFIPVTWRIGEDSR